MKRTLIFLTIAVASGAAITAVALAASSPSVVSGTATNIMTSSAILHGSVNPNGAATTYYFEWGLTNSYGIVGHTRTAGSGTKAVVVQATPTGLIPGTTYHYRLVASNTEGTSTGADRTFTTTGHPPPDVATGPATNIDKSGATLTGTVNPNGEATTYTFQYGTTTSYGVETFAQNLPAGTTPQAVSVTLTGLEPGTTFYYRLVGLHDTDVVQYGDQESFFTYPDPRPVPKVTSATSPHHAPSRPYTFTTSGKITGPSNIPASLACFGNGTLRFFLGSRQVASELVPITSQCTYSQQTTFNQLPSSGHKPRRVLHVLFHFRGNGYLAPADASAQTVTAG